MNMNIWIEQVPDSDADLSYLQPLPHDDVEKRAAKQGRLDALERGDWQPVGVVAKCRVGLEHGTAVFQSSGAWGVESDSPALREITLAQLEELRQALIEAFGVWSHGVEINLAIQARARLIQSVA
jgi:hypothetical protein